VRNFVRGIKVTRIRDAKTEMTASLTAELTQKFAAYGVVIE